MKPLRKYQISRPIQYWPAPHINKVLREEKQMTGKALTLLIDESLAQRYGLSLNPLDSQPKKYPAHKAGNYVLTDKFTPK